MNIILKLLLIVIFVSFFGGIISTLTSFFMCWLDKKFGICGPLTLLTIMVIFVSMIIAKII
jgi:hypothetical protein